ncbi:MAG: site-specific DNA-methyltransferase [Phycisphaerales bacterium]|nr:site-specific DNA-methyltransferase [Phycisphaerales bacterium]
MMAAAKRVQFDVRMGDCIDLITTLAPASIDFIYLDPPFNTGRTHKAARGAFRDVFAGVDGYIAFLKPRIECMQRVLKPEGSILVHCDWHASHRVRVLLDEVFGSERFLNHLIWQYGLGGSSPRVFARKHDDLLWYAKGTKWHFTPPRVPATSRRMLGQTKKATDVLDIPSINNMSKERCGWPTQKPLALLEMLVEACCPLGGTVLDPFCGSGTTLVAAQSLGRDAIGFDISKDAVALTKSRLQSTHCTE